MKLFYITILLCIFLFMNLNAQTDTTSSIDLLSEITEASDQNIVLLPEHILFSQKILWGENGFMRNFDKFELTPEKRQNELKIRRFMLGAHQILGFATLGGMIAQGIVGARLYNGEDNLKSAHEMLASAVNIGYFTTAGLAIFTPPKLIDEREGYGSIKLHKTLAIIHFTSMIATNILAGMVESNPDLKPYHRAAAYTAFGSFAAAMIVIKF
jgi:hypothetical protein